MILLILLLRGSDITLWEQQQMAGASKSTTVNAILLQCVTGVRVMREGLSIFTLQKFRVHPVHAPEEIASFLLVIQIE